MDENEWRPLFIRESGEESDFDVLQDGVPRWLEASLWRWLMDRAAEGGLALINRLERRLHTELTSYNDRRLGGQQAAPNAVIERYWKSSGDRERLTLLDAILRDLQDRGAAAIDEDNEHQVQWVIGSAEQLHTILTEGGSLWGAHVGPPSWGLVRRINGAMADLVSSVTAPDTDAARKIASAWNACYRHDPDYDTAYRQAVLAVEAVAIPLVLPDASKATLGTVIAHIRDTVARWSVGALDAGKMASGNTLLEMLKTLWHNQQRHARADGTVIDVTREEAEAAVSLSVTLVHWFTGGLVTKADA